MQKKKEVFSFPGLFHMESMEGMLAETPANFLFYGHHGFHMECRHIHLGFHGTVYMDSIRLDPSL